MAYGTRDGSQPANQSFPKRDIVYISCKMGLKIHFVARCIPLQHFKIITSQAKETPPISSKLDGTINPTHSLATVVLPQK